MHERDQARAAVKDRREVRVGHECEQRSGQRQVRGREVGEGQRRRGNESAPAGREAAGGVDWRSLHRCSAL